MSTTTPLTLFCCSAEGAALAWAGPAAKAIASAAAVRVIGSLMTPKTPVSGSYSASDSVRGSIVLMRPDSGDTDEPGETRLLGPPAQ
jgi:hypothetical protein